MTRRAATPVLALLAAGATLTACSTGTGPSVPTEQPGTTVPRHHTGLAALPLSGAPSSGYPRLVSGRGRGDRLLGTVHVGSGRIYVQTVCAGPGALSLVGLFAEGPCNGRAGVSSFAAPSSGRLTIDVKASPRTEWAVFVSQAS